MNYIIVLVACLCSFSKAEKLNYKYLNIENPEEFVQYAKLSIAYDFDSDECKIANSGRRLQTTDFIPIRTHVLNTHMTNITAALTDSAITEIQTDENGKIMAINFECNHQLQFDYHDNLKIDSVVATWKLNENVIVMVAFAEALQNMPCVVSVGIAPVSEGSADMRSPEFIRFVKPPSKANPALEHLIPKYPNDPLTAHSWWYSSYTKLLLDYPSEGDKIVNPRIQDAHQIWNGGSTNFKILASDSFLSQRNYDQMNSDGETALWVNEGENGGPWTGEFGESCYDNIDNDGNGYVDDCGLSLIPTSSSATHGTMSVGLMTGVTDNGVSLASTCPGCKTAPVGVFSPFSSIDYAITINANVLNIPYVYWRYELYQTENIPFAALVKQYIASLKAAIVLYEQTVDGIVVSAAGNVPGNLDECSDDFYQSDPIWCKSAPFGWPCSMSSELPNMMCVGASDKFGKPSQYATYGARTVSVFAPGVNLEVLWSESTATRSGSSLSAGIVSGIAGLIRSAFPDLTARQVKTVLIASCKKGDGLENMCECGGIIDAVNAMAHAAICTVTPQNCGNTLDKNIVNAHDHESIMAWFCALAAKYGAEKVPLCKK